MEISTTAQSTEANFSSFPVSKAREAVNFSYGSICCLCFLIGTLGNFVSFFFFKCKKRDISSVIYMLITANDIVVSITVLPVGISALSQGQPGLIFGNKYGCETWYGIWNVAIKLSVFLVLCLSVTRTFSLLRPFQRQKIKYFVLAVGIFMVINVAFEATMSSRDYTRMLFLSEGFRCILFVAVEAAFIVFTVNDNLFYTSPAIVVAMSCVISVVVLTRRNKVGNLQQKELQQSRNRATVTILLFALLYGVCNIPLLIDFVVLTYEEITGNMQVYYNFYQFDKHLYYRIVTLTLLPAANSAANPILYFWRMPALREYIMSGIRRMLPLGLNREVRRPAVQQAETQPCNRVVENINIAQQLPASKHLETVL